MNDVAGAPGGKNRLYELRRLQIAGKLLRGCDPSETPSLGRWVSKQNMIYGLLLTKRQVKIWLDIVQVLFLRVYGPRPWTRKKKTGGQCPSILTEQAWSIKDLQYYLFTVNKRKAWTATVLFWMWHVCGFTIGMIRFSHSTRAIPRTIIVLIVFDFLFN